MDEQTLWLLLLALAGTALWKRHVLADFFRSAAAAALALQPFGFLTTGKAAATMKLPGDASMVPGAARALRNPPSNLDAARLVIRRENTARERFAIPIGWYADRDGVPALDWTTLTQTKHILITGKSGSGKEALSRAMLFTLAQEHEPDELRIAIFDGKGIDWSAWERVPHTWLLVEDPEEIKAGLDRVTAELNRRRLILRKAGVTDWSNYTGGDLPLLVVFVTELTLLQDAIGEKQLTAWLNTQLARARAFGVRFIVQTQTVANFATRWRSQIDLFVAGFQPSGSQDTPNASVPAADLLAIGAVPPSHLPSVDLFPGCFTWVRERNSARTCRTSRVDDAQIEALIARLARDSGGAESFAGDRSYDSGGAESSRGASAGSGTVLPLSIGSSASALPGSASGASALPGSASRRPSAVEALAEALPDMPELRPRRRIPAGSAGLAEAPEAPEAPEALAVSAEEEAQIIEAARRLNSRREVAEAVYGSGGGRGMQKVSQVCNRAGLLMPVRRVRLS